MEKKEMPFQTRFKWMAGQVQCQQAFRGLWKAGVRWGEEVEDGDKRMFSIIKDKIIVLVC